MRSRLSMIVILVGLLGGCGAAGDISLVGTTTPSPPIATTAGVTPDAATTTTALTQPAPISTVVSVPATQPSQSPSVVTDVVTTEPPPPTEPPPTPPVAQIPGSDQFPLHFTSLQDYSKGQIVRTVQQRLIDWGYIDIVVDGEYGPATRDAVEEVQARAGLVVDGLVGPKTYAVLVGPVLPPD